MAKKSRTPPPPRRVQAPKRRTAERDPRRTRLLLGAVAAAIVVGAAAVGIAMAVGGGEERGGGLEGTGCEAKSFPSQGRSHTPEPEKGFEYNSFPPTSGPHHPTPAVWDVYDRPIEQHVLVHNLEHGGVVVQYGDEVPQATVDDIIRWYRDDPNGILVAPLPRLGDKIALTAWRNLATCTTFDEEAFDSFVEEHRYKGPEEFPPELLEPGQ